MLILGLTFMLYVLYAFLVVVALITKLIHHIFGVGGAFYDFMSLKLFYAFIIQLFISSFMEILISGYLNLLAPMFS